MTTTTKPERPHYEAGGSQALDPRRITADVERGAAHTFSPAEFEGGSERLEAMCVVGLDRRGLLTLEGEPIPLHRVVSRSEIEEGHVQFIAGPTAQGEAFDAFLFAIHDGQSWSSVPTEMTIRIVASSVTSSAASEPAAEAIGSENDRSPIVDTAVAEPAVAKAEAEDFAPADALDVAADAATPASDPEPPTPVSVDPSPAEPETRAVPSDPTGPVGSGVQSPPKVNLDSPRGAKKMALPAALRGFTRSDEQAGDGWTPRASTVSTRSKRVEDSEQVQPRVEQKSTEFTPTAMWPDATPAPAAREKPDPEPAAIWPAATTAKPKKAPSVTEPAKREEPSAEIAEPVVPAAETELVQPSVDAAEPVAPSAPAAEAPPEPTSPAEVVKQVAPSVEPPAEVVTSEESVAPVPEAVTEPVQPAAETPVETAPTTLGSPDPTTPTAAEVRRSTLEALEKAPTQLVELGFDLAAEPPSAGDNVVSTDEGSFYAFKPSDFNFVGPESRFQRIRVVAVETCGELTFDHRPVVPGQEIEVEDIALDLLRFYPSDPGKEGFEFLVFDGVEWSVSPNSMMIQVKPHYLPPTASNQTVEVEFGERFGIELAHFGYRSLCAGDSLQKVRITDYELTGTVSLDGIEIDPDQVLLREELDGNRVEYLPRQAGDADRLRFLVHDGTAYSKESYVLRFVVREPALPPVATESEEPATELDPAPAPAPEIGAETDASPLAAEFSTPPLAASLTTDDAEEAEIPVPEIRMPEPEEAPLPEVPDPDPIPGRLPGAVSPAEVKRSGDADPMAGTRLPGPVTGKGSPRFEGNRPVRASDTGLPTTPEADSSEVDRLRRADLTPQSEVTHRNPLPPADGDVPPPKVTPAARVETPKPAEPKSKPSDGPARPRPGKLHKPTPSDSRASGRWRASSPTNKEANPAAKSGGATGPHAKAPLQQRSPNKGGLTQPKRPVPPSVGPAKKAIRPADTSGGATPPTAQPGGKTPVAKQSIAKQSAAKQPTEKQPTTRPPAAEERLERPSAETGPKGKKTPVERKGLKQPGTKTPAGKLPGARARRPEPRKPVKPGETPEPKPSPRRLKRKPPTEGAKPPVAKKAPSSSSGSFKAIPEAGAKGGQRIRRDYDLVVSTPEDQAYAFSPLDLSPNDIPVSEVEILTVDCPGFLQFEAMAVTKGQRFTRAEMEEGLLTYLPAAMGTKKCFTYRVRRGPKWSTARCTMSVQVTRAYG